MNNIRNSILLIIIILLLPIRVYANDVGFPVDPVGYRHLALSLSSVFGERDMTQKSTRLIHKTKLAGFGLKADYGFTDRVDVFLRLGANNLDISDVPFNGNMGFDFSIGLKGSLYKSPVGWNFTATGMYTRFSSNDNNINLVRDETLAALTVSQKMAYFKPYIGVLLTQARIFKDIVYEPETHIGLLLGLEYEFQDNFSGNFEAHLVNENLFRFGLTYKFGRTFP